MTIFQVVIYIFAAIGLLAVLLLAAVVLASVADATGLIPPSVFRGNMLEDDDDRWDI